jgi:hypothetical protein
MVSDSKSIEEFDVNYLDKIIRQIISSERTNYLENGESARGIPTEIKNIIQKNINQE